MGRRTRFGAVLLALGLLVAACGNGSTTDTTEPAAPLATEATDGTSAAPAETTAPPETAAADPYAALVEAATTEGKVTIYSSQAPDALDVLAAAFEERYPGIEVEVFRAIDGETQTKVEAEVSSGAGIADMLVSASLSWVEDKSTQGWFLPPAAPNLVGEGGYDVAAYVHGDYFETNAAVLAFGWNTDLLPDGISDYPDFLSADLSGVKIGVIEPGAPSIVDFYVWLEENFGSDFLDKLSTQDLAFYPSSLPMGEAMSSGEIVAGMFVAPVALIPAQEAGAPVEFGLSPVGAWGARYYGMLLASGPHPNGAQLLADYMVSSEGQAILGPGAGAVQEGIPGALITNDLVRIQDYALLTEEFVADFVARFDATLR